MDRSIQRLLDSNNPEDRKSAIKTIAREANPGSLGILSTIYRDDPDPTVRELALKAGRFIKKKQAEAAIPFTETSGTTGSDGEMVNAATPEPVRKVTDIDRERARGLVSQAMDLSLRGETNKARNVLAKALALDPELKYDSYTRGVAGELFDTDGDEAIEELMLSAGKPKRKRGEAYDDGPGWGAALTDLSIYGLVQAGVTIVAVILTMQFMIDLWESFAELSARGDYAMQDMSMGIADVQAEILNQLLVSGIGITIIYGLMAGLLSIIGLLFYYSFFHIVGKFMLGGDGTFTGLIHKVTGFLTVVTAVSFVLGLVYLFLPLNSFLSLELAYSQGSLPRDEYGRQMVNAIQFQNLFMLLSIVLGLGVSVWVAKLIGENYRFGTGRGCATIMISYILLVAISFGCICASSAALGSFIGGMMGM